MLGLEFDVEYRSDDLNDLADVVLLFCFGVGLSDFFSLGADSCCHDYPSNAAEPPTISAISCVICAWRARLNVRRKTLSISPALSVAFFIAVRCALWNPASFSTSAR